MKIEIWSDYACPFCYMGKVRLKKALDELGLSADIEFKAFQLDPTMEEGVELNPVDNLASKYGVSREEAMNMIQQMVDMAKEDGLDYDFEALIETNTLRAHELMKYGEEMGKGEEMNEAIFKAHLIEGKHIGDIDSLVELGQSVGLNPVDTRKYLEKRPGLDKIKGDMEEARSLGINSVPFFVFNRKYALQGAQPVEVFKEVLVKD